MRRISIIALALAASACAVEPPKTQSCLTLDDKELVCVDDHVGKDGKEEVKADIIEAVEAL